jgi:hypothetical protein
LGIAPCFRIEGNIFQPETRSRRSRTALISKSDVRTRYSYTNNCPRKLRRSLAIEVLQRTEEPADRSSRVSGHAWQTGMFEAEQTQDIDQEQLEQQNASIHCLSIGSHEYTSQAMTASPFNSRCWYPSRGLGNSIFEIISFAVSIFFVDVACWIGCNFLLSSSSLCPQPIDRQ